ncbi:MAG: nucleotidyltransferase domain-containing protein [Halanaerobiales bacterium]
MITDTYILSVIQKYRVNNHIDITTQIQTINPIEAIIKNWANSNLNEIKVSGSRAKGTAINLSSDLDLFISLNSNTSESLKQIYESLYSVFHSMGLQPRRQNSSIGIKYNGLKVDIVPGKIRPGNNNYHSIYRSKINSWTQTNVDKNIALVKNSGRLNEIIALKIWRELNNINFPSVYLELTVLNALYNKNKYQITENFVKILEYLRDDFVGKIIIDPTNSNNVISDDLHKYEKELISQQAVSSLSQKYLQNIIW